MVEFDVGIIWVAFGIVIGVEIWGLGGLEIGNWMGVGVGLNLGLGLRINLKNP